MGNSKLNLQCVCVGGGGGGGGGVGLCCNGLASHPGRSANTPSQFVL